MKIIDKCYNCQRCYLKGRKLFCEIKNKVLYEEGQHTDNYFWCKGKYQQQIGREGRSLDEV